MKTRRNERDYTSEGFRRHLRTDHGVVIGHVRLASYIAHRRQHAAGRVATPHTHAITSVSDVQLEEKNKTMTKEITVLLVTAAGQVETRKITPDLKTLQSLVGGYIESLTLPGQTHIYLNEEGKLHGLPYNAIATKIVNDLIPGFKYHDYIAGDAIFLGSTNYGDETDAPPWLTALAEANTATID